MERKARKANVKEEKAEQRAAAEAAERLAEEESEAPAAEESRKKSGQSASKKKAKAKGAIGRSVPETMFPGR